MKNVVAYALAALLVCGSAFGVSRLQPGLAATVHSVKERDDVITLPPPNQMKIADLGYDAATVDLLWTQILVQYGLHGHEKRVFNALPSYLDAVLALEPDYAPLFKYVDTLLVYKYPVGTEDDARLARRYLERGIEARSYDHRMWTEYGDFIAFIAPSFLKSEDDIKQWRIDGARAMAKAVELGADPDRSLSAATMLSRAGEVKAVVRFLQRAYATTDDPAVREQIALKLAALNAEAERQVAVRDSAVVDDRWRHDLPFLTRGEWLLVGPLPDPLRCVGPGTTASPELCARDWAPLLPSAAARDW